MLLRNFLPSPWLQEFVRFIGIVHFNFPDLTAIPGKPYSPRPETSLCFFPKMPEYLLSAGDKSAQKRPQIVISGQHTCTNIHYPTGPEFLAIVVHFQPGILYRLAGMPVNELTNNYVAAELLLPKEVQFISERLNYCRSYSEMIAVIESSLIPILKRLKKAAHGIDAATRLILQSSERLSIDWLAKETCLCAKQFERKFKERNGVSASTLSRIVRFDRTVKMKNAQPARDWLSVAVQCGYHDYQHLVRDYKEFTGLTPTAYFQLDTQAPESLFGLYEESTVYQL